MRAGVPSESELYKGWPLALVESLLIWLDGWYHMDLVVR